MLPPSLIHCPIPSYPHPSTHQLRENESKSGVHTPQRDRQQHTNRQQMQLRLVVLDQPEEPGLLQLVGSDVSTIGGLRVAVAVNGHSGLGCFGGGSSGGIFSGAFDGPE